MASEMLKTIVDMMRTQRSVMPPELDPVMMRANMESMTGLLPLPPDVVAEPTSVNDVPAEWVSTPDVDAAHVVLYLHGGAYVLGSVNTHRDLAGRLSRASGARVLNVDYRLAPEHPHPAAVDDATAAYRWLLDAGHEPGGLAVAGDSAGGGLTIATLVALRDAGLPMPAAGVCLSPWVDLEGTGESMETRAHLDPMVQKDHLVRMAKLYLAAHHPRTPLAAPLYADLSGLPPLLIQVGTAETLLDDATRIAERARKAGVEVTLEVWDDMIHVFQAFAPMLAEGQQAIEGIGEYLRARWA
jgi:monoterpene epsilon-lactone hydrolase